MKAGRMEETSEICSEYARSTNKILEGGQGEAESDLMLLTWCDTIERISAPLLPYL